MQIVPPGYRINANAKTAAGRQPIVLVHDRSHVCRGVRPCRSERCLQNLQICKFANFANTSPSYRIDMDMNTEKAAQRQPRGSMGGMSHVAICIAESCTARDLFAKIANLQMLQIDLQATELTWVRIRRRPLGDSRVAPWVGCHMVPCIAESCTARDPFAKFANL